MVIIIITIIIAVVWCKCLKPSLAVAWPRQAKG